MLNSNFFQRTQFPILISLICMSWNASANNYPAVNPANMDAVILQIMADYGSEIQVSQDQITLFLTNIQTNYNPDLATPLVKATAGGSTFITFKMGSTNTYTGGYLNLDNGSSGSNTFTGLSQTFDALAGAKLHLFAFVVTDGAEQGQLTIIVTRPHDLIIIIDIKILLQPVCDDLQTIVTSTNTATVLLPQGARKAYEVEIRSAISNNVLDQFYVYLTNLNQVISGTLLNGSLFPQNTDNNVTTAGKVTSSNAGARVMRFTPLMVNNSLVYNAFSISDNTPQSDFSIIIKVSECTEDSESEAEALIQTSTAKMISPYPNPTNGLISVGLEEIEDDEIFIEIFDKSGNLVYSRNPVIDKKSKLEIDISHLPADLYMVRLRTPNHVHTTKVIKW
jgi:Secretion system C-terminal sorting domain